MRYGLNWLSTRSNGPYLRWVKTKSVCGQILVGSLSQIEAMMRVIPTPGLCNTQPLTSLRYLS